MLIYTDGSCIRNKYGGWAFCIVGKTEDIIVCDSHIDTTNNRMELTAVIEALDFIEDKSLTYTINTDSQLTMNCALGKWKRKANKDLWKQFDIVSKGFNLKWKWVKAHNGDYYNEIVDH